MPLTGWLLSIPKIQQSIIPILVSLCYLFLLSGMFLPYCSMSVAPSFIQPECFFLRRPSLALYSLSHQFGSFSSQHFFLKGIIFICLLSLSHYITVLQCKLYKNQNFASLFYYVPNTCHIPGPQLISVGSITRTNPYH